MLVVLSFSRFKGLQYRLQVNVPTCMEDLPEPHGAQNNLLEDVSGKSRICGGKGIVDILDQNPTSRPVSM